MVQMDMQQSRATNFDRLAQSRFHQFQVIQAFSSPEIDDDVCSSKGLAISGDKVIVSLLIISLVDVFWPILCGFGVVLSAIYMLWGEGRI
jgi:hypothetical protein